jgi:hypothetical protein
MIANKKVETTAPAFSGIGKRARTRARAIAITAPAYTMLKNRFITILQCFPFYKLCSLNHRANAFSCFFIKTHLAEIVVEDVLDGAADDPVRLWIVEDDEVAVEVEGKRGQVERGGDSKNLVVFQITGHQNVDFQIAGHQNVNFKIAGHQNVNFQIAGHQNVDFQIANHQNVDFQIAYRQNFYFQIANHQNFDSQIADRQNAIITY